LCSQEKMPVPPERRRFLCVHGFWVVNNYLVALLGWLLISAAEHHDRQQSDQARMLQIETQLRAAALRLEKNLDSMLQVNYDFASALPPDLSGSTEALQPLAERLLAGHRRLINVTLSRNFEVVFVYPFAGNEAVLGMNYANRPYIMTGVQRAIEQRGTVVTGPISLVQSGRLGLVGRTPVFAPSTEGKPGAFKGVVSTAIDLDGVLADAGLVSSTLPFDLAIRGRDGSGAQGEVFFGDPALFKQAHAGVDLNLPGGSWRVAAIPKHVQRAGQPAFLVDPRDRCAPHPRAGAVAACPTALPGHSADCRAA
jgi:sensor domain CHASE-containing protein